ncbi:hypothetical protein DdX_20514 [Ditylenchus destructor]|uniref:F-box domain-containing protein n=1 Tax=Ditylenchus destructor TaxID=166010 RepID=A0AAD4MIK7_9BILA|nr:hypothetical protein DdX_20514 [Ditylenchus destructor]
MSNSKPLPPFTFDVLYYLNRNQLERFSIVCRPLKKLIDRYFGSKPYRILDELYIRGGSCALIHNDVKWHPNRDDYSAQQFLANQRAHWDAEHYSFAEMRPYLAATIRIRSTFIDVAAGCIYNLEHVEEMESIAHLWRDGNIDLRHGNYGRQIVAEDFQLILSSPTILRCRKLVLTNAQFSFKDYKVFYALKDIENWYGNGDVSCNSWLKFLEQAGVKPTVVFRCVRREVIDIFSDRLSKVFSSAVSPNTFKIVFVDLYEELSEFRETNNTLGEILELKKRLPVECQNRNLKYNNYTLERSRI